MAYLGDSRPACSKKSSVIVVRSKDNVIGFVQDIRSSFGENSGTKFELILVCRTKPIANVKREAEAFRQAVRCWLLFRLFICA